MSACPGQNRAVRDARNMHSVDTEKICTQNLNTVGLVGPGKYLVDVYTKEGGDHPK